MNHTPGPWHVSVSGPTVYALHGHPPRNRFSSTMQGGRWDDAQLPELLANARLIAAAPDLLSALSAMMTHMGGKENSWNKPTFDQARRAIAKATGKEQA